jgi:anti-anti-sigma factor
MTGVFTHNHVTRASFDVTQHAGVVNIRMRGELDLESAGDLADVLESIRVRDGELVQLDARGVDFIDCSALTVIQLARKTLAGRGVTLWIVSPSLCVRALLEMTSASDLFAPGDATDLHPSEPS